MNLILKQINHLLIEAYDGIVLVGHGRTVDEAIGNAVRDAWLSQGSVTVDDISTEDE